MTIINEYKDVDLSDYRLKTYTAPSQFGSTESSTPSEIYSSMPSNSLLVVSSNTLTNSGWNFPNTYLSIFIVHISSSRGYVLAYGKSSNQYDYRMFLTDNDVLSGSWEQISNIVSKYTGTPSSQTYHADGYITTSNTEAIFMIPVSTQNGSISSVSCSTVTIRQNGSYLINSQTFSGKVSYTEGSFGTRITLTYSSSIGGTNNDCAAISAELTIKFN